MTLARAVRERNIKNAAEVKIACRLSQIAYRKRFISLCSLGDYAFISILEPKYLDIRVGRIYPGIFCIKK